MEDLKTLIIRAQGGDLDAYGEIVRRFQDMAYGYAYSILGDFHLAEDAAQEAFIQAYRDLGQLRKAVAFPGWFRRIVFKHCDRLTRGKHVPTVPLQGGAEIRSRQPGPVETAERREMKDAVLAAIRALPENERTVTTLFYINGYSQKDIATFLEVPVTTVNNRLHASRTRLKERVMNMVEETLKSSPLPERFAEVIMQMNFVNERISPVAAQLRKASAGQMQAKTAELRSRLTAGEARDMILAEAFALVQEATHRAHSQPHYEVQLVASMFLDEGWIAEEAAGEGKSIIAYPAAYMAVVEGKHVHITTVNDHLVCRDAEHARMVFALLGVTVGYITADMPANARREAYRCNITYGMNTAFAFDYLTDSIRSAGTQPIQGPLDLAIIDEADSVLIDEARTQVILTAEKVADVDCYRKADAAAQQLIQGNKAKGGESALYQAGSGQRSVQLTDEGWQAIKQVVCDDVQPRWRHLVEQALRAHLLLKKDSQYVVVDRMVIVIDEFIGRVLADRQWSGGLHQGVEAKEHVPITPEAEGKASICFGDYFKRYSKVAGMTGTAKQQTDRFGKEYGLEVVAVPTHLAGNRIDHGDRVYPSDAARCEAVLDEVAHYSRDLGRPVLVATTSVSDCERISQMLSRWGIEHQVLNARPERAAREAEVVAAAGERRPAKKGNTDAAGAVTVATSMAGRGTDIVLPKGVRGGLHVIGVGRHAVRRIDDQFRNRAGRQGQPGSSRFFLSLDDEFLAAVADRLQFGGAPFIEDKDIPGVIERAQREAERRYLQTRIEYTISRQA